MKKIALLDAKADLIPFWNSLNLKAQFVAANWSQIQNDKRLTGIYLDPMQSEEIKKDLRQITREIKAIGYFDFLEMTKFGPSPMSLMRKFGLEMIRTGIQSLDIRKVAYITGTNPWSKVFGILAGQLGFKNVIFVVKNLEQSHQLLNELKAISFGVEFSSMLDTELTLQPNNASLLVNTILQADDPALISDLSYLNFLSLSGLVIDIHESNLKSLLIEETRNSKISLIDGFHVQSFIEYNVLTKQTGLLASPITDYLEKRKSFLMK